VKNVTRVRSSHRRSQPDSSRVEKVKTVIRVDLLT